MMHTLGSAAKLTGKSKSTLLRAVQSGRMSGSRDDSGNYQIETSELLRVFPATVRDEANDAPRTGHRNPAEQAEIDGLRALLDERQRTIDDLRTRLDQESEERRKLTAMLTDQRKPEPPPESPAKGLWARVFGRPEG